MTSPSTLVVSSEQGNWEGLPWWNANTLQLQSPHNYLNDTEKSQLAFWLNNLSREIRRYNGDSKAIDRIVGLLNGFINSLGLTSTANFQFSENPAYFEVEINRGALTALNLPVKVESRESNVRIVPSLSKQNVPPLLIIDPNIATAWNEPPQNICVYEGKNLAAFRTEDIETWNKSRKVICLESKDLFLPDLKFIDQEGILPGALLPEGTQSLVFKNRNITPLIPLNPILLNYFTPEDLTKKVKLQLVNNGAGGSQVRLTLTLPLYGVKGGKAPQNFFLVKDYPLLEENIIYEVPVLEIWPNFKAEGWQEYYGFYYDAEYGEETFQISFPTAKNTHTFKEGQGAYQVVRLEEFPALIECKDIYTNTIGLILLPSPEEIRLTGEWVVGIDFGTSFTNVYVNKNDRLIERLSLENLHCKVTDVSIDTRFPVLFEFFIPESFIPIDKPFPMSTVLTNRGATKSKDDQINPIFDGRLYVPNLQRFAPQETWIKTNLKWSTNNPTDNQLFLKHLALHIAAIAAKNGVSTIQWSLSFPSAFSPKEQQNYAINWQRLTKELASKTGIIHNSPAKDDPTYFRTESLAVAQYFAEQEGYDLVSTTCIDMGGGTSDISIWQDDQLLHQCSVLLAGSHLFSQFIEMNPNFLKKLDPNINDTKDWTKLKGPAFNAKLDVWMRLEAGNWLETKRDRFEEDKDFQGLIRLMAIGISGLYFYVGQILSVLHKEDKYSQNQITPVYIGGNASRLLHWLAEGGEFDRNSEINSLLSHMMSIASGFPDTEELTRLSQNPKDEAACGLVLKDRKLQGLGKKEKDPVIAGEDCKISGENFGWQERLEFKGKSISKYEIPELTQLKLFLNAFHASLDELGIDGIKPLDGYELKEYPDDPDPDYNEKLWRATERELRNSLNAIKGNIEDIREEPPFIIGLKALLRVLGKEWAGK
ncbi:cell division protein FtsA [Anabaena sp. UHCC 0253]|uniref:cell division protein FtsA n=1 Tax=Anabaena sp. UHCC 0253 TaxID=2590019 RepID=UPI001C2C35AC|nr:cell division protein FtsA [Anabaena sp. UHCC 0253]